MGIVDEDIARVRAATDIVALIGEYVQLRQVGARWRGLCPFHPEKTGSFYVNAVDGLYHCFGCQVSGDAITFLRQQEHLDFVGAVERLAGRVGISLNYDKPGENRTRAERKRLVEVVAAAEDWYHQRLLSAPDASAARRYLRDRGFTGDEVREWRLGWAPDDWDQLAKGLKVSAHDLKATGLGFENRRNRAQDHFRGRVLFPIHDADGTPIGFGGRVLPGAEGSKYVNTPQTQLYDKSRVLFGLDRAKADIVNSGEVIVCEGYTDVTAFFRVGLPRAVATCGTALTEEHVQILRKYGRRIVLAFDADAAGQSAAARFYEWEERFELDVLVAVMPAGADPAELAGSDPEALRASVSGARPYLEFRLHRVLDTTDLATPEARARAAEAAIEVISEHPKDLVRDQYLMLVADRCRVDIGRLRERLDEVVRRGPRRDPAPDKGRRDPQRPSRAANDGDPGPRDPGSGGPQARDDRSGGPGSVAPRRGDRARAGSVVDRRDVSPAVEVLRLAVNRPEDVVEWLDECLFEETIHREAFRALVTATTIHEAIESASAEVAAFLSRLAVEEPVDHPLDPVVLLLRSTGLRLIAEERASTPVDLGRMTALARLVDAVGTDPDGLRAAEELLSWASQTGGTG